MHQFLHDQRRPTSSEYKIISPSLTMVPCGAKMTNLCTVMWAFESVLSDEFIIHNIFTKSLTFIHWLISETDILMFGCILVYFRVPCPFPISCGLRTNVIRNPFLYPAYFGLGWNLSSSDISTLQFSFQS